MMVGNMWKRRRMSRSKGRRMIDYMMLIFYIELILLISQVRNTFCLSIKYNEWVRRSKFYFYNIFHLQNNYQRTTLKKYFSSIVILAFIIILITQKSWHWLVITKLSICVILISRYLHFHTKMFPYLMWRKI